MQKYLKILVEDIHSTTVATIGADGHPQKIRWQFLLEVKSKI